MNLYPPIISQGGKLSTSATPPSYSKNMTIDKKLGIHARSCLNSQDLTVLKYVC